MSLSTFCTLSSWISTLHMTVKDRDQVRMPYIKCHLRFIYVLDVTLIKILVFNMMLVVSDLRKNIFLSGEITVDIKMLCAEGKQLNLGVFY